MAEIRKGAPLPKPGIFDVTVPPESETEQGGPAEADDAPEAPAASATPRRRKKTAAGGSPTRTTEVKLYLTDDVKFRLRMQAFKRGVKISEMANEVLDRGLAKWRIERD